MRTARKPMRQMLNRRDFLKVGSLAAVAAATGVSYAARKEQKVLVVGGTNFLPCRGSLGAELYDPAARTFAATRGMPIHQRAEHTATLLGNGMVLLAGGAPEYGKSLAAAELYDPVSQTFSELTNEMTVPRTKHAATLLRDGRVLIAGGMYSAGGTIAVRPITRDPAPPFATPGPTPKHYSGGAVGPLSSAEIYDPVTQTFTSTGSMTVARVRHTATLLDNGLVLVAGGYHGNITLNASAELYDPATGAFRPTGAMNFPRTQQIAVRLRDGRVLVAGGGWTKPSVSITAELYDRHAGTFKRTADMMVGRRELSAAMLADGRVLVAGGKDGYLLPLASAEIYDPATNTSSPTGMMRRAWYFAASTLLANGKVLLTGAIEMLELTKERAPAQEFDPATRTFSNVGDMTPRQDHTATLLPP